MQYIKQIWHSQSHMLCFCMIISLLTFGSVSSHTKLIKMLFILFKCKHNNDSVLFEIDHCVVCPSSIYSSWLPCLVSSFFVLQERERSLPSISTEAITPQIWFTSLRSQTLFKICMVLYLCVFALVASTINEQSLVNICSSSWWGGAGWLNELGR